MTATYLNGTNRVMHVRFDGRSFDVPLEALDVRADASDRQVRQAVARVLEVRETRLDGYVLDRHPNGNLTLRPEAVFG